ncbi:MAG: hypothetical protein WBA93_24880 [Microcoleaceae cyanobacterium]
MFSLLQKKTTTILSGLAVSLGGILVPVNMAQAAVFNFTIPGLGGSGEIGFDDESTDIFRYIYGCEWLECEGVALLGSYLSNGYFNWSFSGTATTRESFYDPYYGYYDYYSSQQVTLSSSYDSDQALSAFNNADFIFDKGELIGIANYSWNLASYGGPTQLDWSLELDYPSATFDYFSGYYSIWDGSTSTTYLNQSGSQQFSTIVPWKNPNPPAEKVPEPNTVFALVGIGLLLSKKNSSHRKNYQKSENINSK